MPNTHRPYAPEFRQQIVELVQSGHTPEELALEYEPSAGAIRNWVAQEERNSGRREDGLSSDERQELRRLRRENKQLRIERDILKNLFVPLRWTLGGPETLALQCRRCLGRHDRQLIGAVASPSKNMVWG